MTTADPFERHDDAAIDRMAAMHREQLSALVDGELPSDQARFLIRRLEHDEELAGCHERWQLVGDALRGQLGAVAPVDFSARVSAALDQAAVPAVAPRRRGSRYWLGGGALAAALAVMALVPVPVLRHGPDAAVESPVVVQVPGTGQDAGTAVAMDAEAKALPAVGLATPSQAVPAPVARHVARVAPRPAMPARKPLAPATLPPAQAGVLVAATPATGETSESSSPFSLPGARPEARPWPRSTLSANDRFNVRLSPGSAAANPFAPEVAAEHLHAADPGVR